MPAPVTVRGLVCLADAAVAAVAALTDRPNNAAFTTQSPTRCGSLSEQRCREIALAQRLPPG